MPYLSICAVYRDEAPYLREWVMFHHIVGVERFYLYNHASADDHRAALEPFVEADLVDLRDWPDVVAPQHSIYDDCLREHREESRWIAFLDLDEFLFSPSRQPLPEVLSEYERWPAVGVNWVMFGTSGHCTRPPGLVIESYLHRANSTEELWNRRFKSIVDPARATRCEDAHHFAYREGQVVDEHQRPIEGPVTDSPSHSRLLINHYWTKSEEDLAKKFSRPRASDGWLPPPPDLERLDRGLNAERDETILSYVPAVHAALDR